ncbi:MAG: hypothetical protein VW262_06025 [Flavobacteriaceae bacterium]|jgi:hypothetical protein
MPAKLDRCVQDLMNDPDFKPYKGRTKEQSAYAVCNSQVKKSNDPVGVCFSNLMKDPNFKPPAGKTKAQAAYAACKENVDQPGELNEMKSYLMSQDSKKLNKEKINMTLKKMLFKGRGAIEDQVKHLKDMLRNDFSPKLKQMLREEIRRLEEKMSNMDKGYGDKKKKCPNCGHKM